jgi:7-cyano-7-deazaguanine synthase
MKSIALLSGGLDSTVSLHIATEKTDVALALIFDYGQKAVKKEIEASKAIANHYKIPHRVVALPWLAEITSTALVHEHQSVPTPTSSELDDDTVHATARAVWVPNRNGVFINVAAAFAESLDVEFVITGFNAEEAISFPDNSMMFVESIKKSLQYSTLNHVKVVSHVQALNKNGIVRLAREKGVPIELCWSCYLGGETPCGTCESCLRKERAMGEI